MRLNLAVALSVCAIGGMLPAQPAAAEPDQTQGVAILSAVVDPAGTLERGAGVASVVVVQTGVKQITFTRPVTACMPVVAIHQTLQDSGVGPLGFATVVTITSIPDAVRVTTRSDTAVVNLPFSLIVFCPQ